MASFGKNRGESEEQKVIKSLQQQNLIIQMIKGQLVELMEENYNFYKEYTVKISKEQDFDKHVKNGLTPKTIFVVVKFGGASINFGQTVLPVTFTVLSEQNKCDIAYTLLTDYVNKYNLESNQDLTIKQVYESPSVSSNFNVAFEGYRSVLNVTAFFVISENANFFEYWYYKLDNFVLNNEINNIFTIELTNQVKFIEKIKELFGGINSNLKLKFIKELEQTNLNGNIWLLEKDDKEICKKQKLEDFGINIRNLTEDQGYNQMTINFDISCDLIIENIPTITKIGSWDAVPDTQPFFNRSNFAETEIKTGHLTFSFTTFLLSNIEIVNDALKIAFKKNSVNLPFLIATTFKSEELNTVEKYKLLSLNYQQDLGDIPVISLTFGM